MADSTPTVREVRRFVIVQWVLTAVFMVVMGVISLQLSGPGYVYPPIWLIAILMALVAVCAVITERAYLAVSALDPAQTQEEWQRKSMRVFAHQTGRALMICVVPILISAIISVVWARSWGPWPIIVTALPALIILVWETWPHSRNTSIIAAMLDAGGADCGLVRRFLRS